MADDEPIPCWHVSSCVVIVLRIPPRCQLGQSCDASLVVGIWTTKWSVGSTQSHCAWLWLVTAWQTAQREQCTVWIHEDYRTMNGKRWFHVSMHHWRLVELLPIWFISPVRKILRSGYVFIHTLICGIRPFGTGLMTWCCDCLIGSAQTCNSNTCVRNNCEVTPTSGPNPHPKAGFVKIISQDQILDWAVFHKTSKENSWWNIWCAGIVSRVFLGW